MSIKTNRRQFIQGAAATAAAASVSGYWISGVQTWADIVNSKSPNEKVNFASIGIGGKGDSDSEHVAKRGNMIAICDVDKTRLDSKNKKLTKENGKAADAFQDFRKMFDKHGKEIDAVTISTPDHMHAVATMTAMKLGKHVYTQKPMTHDVWEARQLRETAKSMKLATQMGNQGTASPKLREGVELIQAGMLGDVTEVHIWTNRPIWPQSPTITTRPPPAPVPDYLDWNLWLGTAPERPYAKDTYHSFKWRGWWDFGTGALGDMGCHTANLPFMALKLQYPTSILGHSEPVNPETYPGWAHVEYEFPARGDMKACKVNWYEGKKDGVLVHPNKELVAKVLEMAGVKGKAGKEPALNNSGSIVVGTKGILYSPHDYGGAWQLLPKEQFENYKAPTPTLPRNPTGDDQGNKDEWIAAIKGGPESVGNFGYAGLLTEFILLGNVGIQGAGKKLEWDGPNMKIPNAPDMEKHLKRNYRAPWSL